MVQLEVRLVYGDLIKETYLPKVFHDPAANPHHNIMELKRELIDHDPNLEPQLSAHNHSCDNDIKK